MWKIYHNWESHNQAFWFLSSWNVNFEEVHMDNRIVVRFENHTFGKTVKIIKMASLSEAEMFMLMFTFPQL